MKIQIAKSLKEGLLILRGYPIIFIPVAIISIVSYFLNLYLNKIIEKSLLLLLSPDILTILSLLPKTEIVLVLLLGNLIAFFLLLTAIDLSYNAFMRRARSLTSAIKLALERFLSVFLASILLFLLILILVCSSIIIAAFLTFALNWLEVNESLINTLAALIILGAVIFAIFLQIKFLYYPYCGLIENQKAIDSLKTSWRITHGNWWQTFALIVITMSATLLLMLLITPFPGTIAILLGMIIQILTTAWAITVLTSAYIQIRI